MSEKKIEQFWRDATADDVARVMDGKTVEARFRCKPSESWWEGSLAGWTSTEPKWYCKKGGMRFWNECQIYDPPGWFVNKPDPGEGWRLLDKFPDEAKLATDDYWSDLYKEWRESGQGDGDQNETIWYRRRIANNPEIPDSSNSSETPNSCRSRDTIPSGWHVLGKDEERLASDAYWSQGCKDWIVIGDDRVEYANDKTGKWQAIRRLGSFDLIVGFNYTLPSGKVVQVTAKGFEVE